MRHASRVTTAQRVVCRLSQIVNFFVVSLSNVLPVNSFVEILLGETATTLAPPLGVVNLAPPLGVVNLAPPVR